MKPPSTPTEAVEFCMTYYALAEDAARKKAKEVFSYLWPHPTTAHPRGGGMRSNYSQILSIMRRDAVAKANRERRGQ